MQLRIRQRIFSWTDSYDVYDEEGQPRYSVKASLFSLTHQIRVFDIRTGLEVGAIRQRLVSLLPTFEIFIGGRIRGTIRRKFTLLTQDYQVDYQGWDVAGDFMGWEYQVMHGHRKIMSITKEFLRLSDTYVLEYGDIADEVPGLLLTIAIDAVNCSKNK